MCRSVKGFARPEFDGDGEGPICGDKGVTRLICCTCDEDALPRRSRCFAGRRPPYLCAQAVVSGERRAHADARAGCRPKRFDPLRIEMLAQQWVYAASLRCRSLLLALFSTRAVTATATVTLRFLATRARGPRLKAERSEQAERAGPSRASQPPFPSVHIRERGTGQSKDQSPRVHCKQDETRTSTRVRREDASVFIHTI